MEKRDLRFDFIRVISMFYIVAILHLSQYISLPTTVVKYYNPWISTLFTNLALSLFSMISGYLIGSKYIFGTKECKISMFYKKRILRFYPLFLLASVILYLIGFNSLKSSVYGLIGISSFVVEQPRTVWYISMLMIFYLITPVISRGNVGWKVLSSSLIIGVACILFKLMKTMDFRFIYNLAFYCFGIILSNQHIPIIDKSTYVYNKTITDIICFVSILVFIVLVPVSYIYFRWLFWFVILIGVMATFSLSMFISRVKNKFVAKIIQYGSYASMACYMFHRFFYWLGVSMYGANNQLNSKWGGCLLLIIFPTCIIASYYIQKTYDLLSNKSKN